MSKKTKPGREAFIAHYRPLFENEADFKACLSALQAPHAPILRFHPRDEKRIKTLWKKQNLTWKTHSLHPHALEWPPEQPLGTDLPGYREHLFYAQNPSSLLPVLALDPHPGETILDACAAPGGKALFIAELMKSKGTLFANDLSPLRRQRMTQTFKDHHAADFIQILKHNAALLFKTFPNHFDRILLDAPCSSEKHVWQSPRHLAEWKPGRIRHLKQEQYGLLKGLFFALKPGGRLVYSTCSITPEENEQVIEKFLRKHPTAKLLSQKRVHPQHEPGMDPMFIATLTKQKDD